MSEKEILRQQQCLQMLEEMYPDAHCELNFSNPFELLIATVLSAQCTDKQVNKVTEKLFQKYTGPQDLAHADISDIEYDIRSIGFFRMKARALQELSQALIANFDGYVPETLADLVRLRGVARKTANVVLWNAFGKNEGIVVDTHVSRIAQRLYLTKQQDPKKIEQDLMKLLPVSKWGSFSHWAIFHGRRVCKARKPDCRACRIHMICPFFQKDSSRKSA